ncbi:MAG: PQQ-dependent sugar dehydrogenase [Actinomycetota bacterium]|nr:PQQ-dependent sugar dehydrogenase [Actinomycetota bacterium]
MYVNIGSASNSCQVENRVLMSPGIDPCPELPVRAGVWAFPAGRLGQTQSDCVRHATGLRNMVALALHPVSGNLWGAQNGRDQLFENWPNLYTFEDDLVLPAEELFNIVRGGDYGWPYCYYDPFLALKVLAPEYGGDGEIQGRCTEALDPNEVFPAHWAPLSMVFGQDLRFPASYQRGAFIAFHGSRFEPELQPQGPGYNVAFVPFARDAVVTDAWTDFADGFAGPSTNLPEDAEHRPVGLAVGPDGSLYVSDDVGGRIWKITYVGS